MLKDSILKELVAWSLENYSNIPWRKNRTTYRTLVSEIMLQQTTVGTVLRHFERFLELYPDIKSLSSSSESEILVAWKGLGYYRRAKNLRNACISLLENFDCKIPDNYEDLISIKGIGPYTANSILAIGMNHSHLAIDANVERVINRIYDLRLEPSLKSQKKISDLFIEKKVLKNFSKIGPRILTEALMDLGRVYCQARSVNCSQCPVRKGCLTYKNKSFEFYLNHKKKIIKSFNLELLRVVVRKKEKILAYRKSEKEWLSGQYELPTFILSTEDPGLGQYPWATVDIDKSCLKSFKTSITKYKITNYIYVVSENEFKKIKNGLKFEFINENIKSSNFSTSTIKTLSRLK